MVPPPALTAGTRLRLYRRQRGRTVERVAGSLQTTGVMIDDSALLALTRWSTPEDLDAMGVDVPDRDQEPYNDFTAWTLKTFSARGMQQRQGGSWAFTLELRRPALLERDPRWILSRLDSNAPFLSRARRVRDLTVTPGLVTWWERRNRLSQRPRWAYRLEIVPPVPSRPVPEDLMAWAEGDIEAWLSAP